MGIVYRAEDVNLGRPVALKFLPGELATEPKALGRFQREARAASALNHPNICTIYEVGEHEGRPFIAMELLEGQTLRERVAVRGRPAPAQGADQVAPTTTTSRSGVQIADALERRMPKGSSIATSSQRISLSPREVKPRFSTSAWPSCRPRPAGSGSGGSVSFADRDGGNRGRAVDQSRRGGGHGRLHVAGAGAWRRTRRPHGPVQFRRGALRDGHRSSGFLRNTSAVIFDAILHKAPTSPVRLNPGCPAELEEIINKALEKDRELRYQTASDMRADLQRSETRHGFGETRCSGDL